MSQKWKTTLVLIQTFEETDQPTDGEDRRSRARVENVIKMTPGPTGCATSRVDDKSIFQLLLPESTEGIKLEMTNLEGKHVFGDTCREVDLVDIQAYVGPLILAGVYCSNNEATKSLWDADSGRPIFLANTQTRTHKQNHLLTDNPSFVKTCEKTSYC